MMTGFSSVVVIVFVDYLVENTFSHVQDGIIQLNKGV